MGKAYAFPIIFLTSCICFNKNKSTTFLLWTWMAEMERFSRRCRPLASHRRLPSPRRFAYTRLGILRALAPSLRKTIFNRFFLLALAGSGKAQISRSQPKEKPGQTIWSVPVFGGDGANCVMYTTAIPSLLMILYHIFGVVSS